MMFVCVCKGSFDDDCDREGRKGPYTMVSILFIFFVCPTLLTVQTIRIASPQNTDAHTHSYVRVVLVW